MIPGTEDLPRGRPLGDGVPPRPQLGGPAGAVASAPWPAWSPRRPCVTAWIGSRHDSPPAAENQPANPRICECVIHGTARSWPRRRAESVTPLQRRLVGFPELAEFADVAPHVRVVELGQPAIGGPDLLLRGGISQ